MPASAERRTLSVGYGDQGRRSIGSGAVAPRQRSADLDVAKAFGLRVREVRLEQELTQEGLAEASGLHPTFISNVERGYRVPSVPTMLRLARGLGVEPSRLVDGLGVA